jgi:protein-S-isoprenylcysteine O-methyltransferase Ste14
MPVPWVFAGAYLAGAAVQLLVPVSVGAEALSLAIRAAGVLSLALGVALAAWAQWIFRRERTTTDPNGTSSSLVTWGPYRFSRNPMYVGLFLFFIGLSGAFAQVWSVAGLLFVFYYLSRVVIPFEESQLRRTFGESYGRYCKMVRRWV